MNTKYCEKCLKKLKVKELRNIVIKNKLFKGYSLLKKKELIQKIKEYKKIK